MTLPSPRRQVEPTPLALELQYRSLESALPCGKNGLPISLRSRCSIDSGSPVSSMNCDRAGLRGRAVPIDESFGLNDLQKPHSVRKVNPPCRAPRRSEIAAFDCLVQDQWRCDHEGHDSKKHHYGSNKDHYYNKSNGYDRRP